MKKINKGEYGYLNYQRKASCLKSLLMFAIPIIIFVVGILMKGKRENILTVVAILGMLPASRSLVTTIMFLRFHSGKEEIYHKTQNAMQKSEDLGAVFFDSVITTEKKSYPVNVFVCCGGNLIGYTQDPKADTKTVEKHIKGMMRNNGIKGITPKLFTDENSYVARLAEILSINVEEETKEKDAEVIALVYALSL